MQKNRKKSGYFQGMEHLKPYIESDNKGKVIEKSDKNHDMTAEHLILKKELIIVLTLMSFLFLVLVGLMVLDQKSDYIVTIADRIMVFIER